MRKRIGLIIGEQDNDYATELVNSIFTEAQKYNYDIFIFANYGIYDHSVYLYGEGEASVYKIPDLDSFDGFILDETLFNIDKMGDLVHTYFEKNARCPVVSLKKKTDRFYDILLGEYDALKELTNHFIKHHKFTKISHMAGRWELQDARVRYRGYEDAMTEAGLNVNHDMVFYGNYWKTVAVEAVDFFLKNEHPEAIVCANDFMAISICDELRKRGVRVPEDICVSGYDNELEGRCQAVPITTSDANIAEFGRMAMETLHEAINGGTPPKTQYVKSNLCLRKSCGCNCDEADDTLEFKYRLANMTRHYYGIDMSIYMHNGYQNAFEIDDIFTNADGYFRYNFSNKGYICLCSDALASTNRPVELLNEYSPNMVLKRVFYKAPDLNYESPETMFERKYILPPELLETDKPTKYYINPIHSQNKCYGYMVSLYDENEYPYHFTQSYVSALGNALDDYNIHNEYMNMDEIKKMYLTDPLTGISNRRGFEQSIILLTDRAKRHTVYLSMVSIDMDDLKSINDTYGHNAGDECLSALGRALQSVVTPEECVARYGGDEFAAILASNSSTRHLTFEESLLKAIDHENELMDKPYKLHASIGLVFVGPTPNGSLVQYMQSADKIMYEKKALYKASKNA